MRRTHSNLANKLVAGGSLGLGAAAITLLAGLLPFFNTLELTTYDWRVRWTADPAAATSDIVLVEIDETTIRALEPLAGRWPWPRVVHASVLEYLARGPARVIAYDVLFTERDRRLAFQYGDDIWTGEESDAALAHAVASTGRVILLADATFEGPAGDPLGDPGPAVVQAQAFGRGYVLDAQVQDRPVITPPVEELAAAAHALGHNLFPLDEDGPVRTTVPFVRTGDRYLPSLGVAAAIAAKGLRPEEIAIEDGRLRLGEGRMPLFLNTLPRFDGPEGQRHAWRAWINYRGPAVLSDGRTRTYETYSFLELLYSEEQILAGEPPLIDPAVFLDRIVFVGVTAAGLHDVFATPFAAGGRMSGIQLHANVADDILSSRFMRQAPAVLRVATTAAGALAVALASLWLPFAAAVLLALGGIGGFLWLAGELFERGLWLNVTQPVVGVALALVGGLAFRYVAEGREKRRIRTVFSRYVSPDVCEQLLHNPALAELGGKRRDMTVLFSDIRGFTSFSEQGSPEEIVAQLNEYFSRMVEVLFQHHGTLDKFVGDMLMGLFGAPLDDEQHADHAVAAALDMISELEALNERWPSQRRPTFDIGIGISTGEMIAGNIGSATIMSYTVIGDAVNLGARLQSLNKEYGTRIIISETTRARLTTSCDLRPLGEVVVKGRSRPVGIYEVRTRVVSGARGPLVADDGAA